MNHIEKKYEAIVFEGKEAVLKAIKRPENSATSLSRFLNYEIPIPISAVVSYAALFFIAVGIKTSYFKPFEPTYAISVINERGEHEKDY